MYICVYALVSPWGQHVLSCEIDDIPPHDIASIHLTDMPRGAPDSISTLYIFVDGTGVDRGLGTPAWSVAVFVDTGRTWYFLGFISLRRGPPS